MKNNLIFFSFKGRDYKRTWGSRGERRSCSEPTSARRSSCGLGREWKKLNIKFRINNSAQFNFFHCSAGVSSTNFSGTNTLNQ